MSLAIKKKFPKFYIWQKKIRNRMPCKIEFWDKQYYNVNYKIKQLFKVWVNNKSEIIEAKTVYKNYKGGDVIDVGAYAGFYSFLLSPKAKSNDNFVNCEPDKIIHPDLLENLAILKKIFQNINLHLISMPISNVKKNIFISHNDYGHPCFRKINQNDKNLKNKKKLISTTIDLLVKSMSLNPTLIKIDTEGAEYEVLQGMARTIKIFKPDIMLEKHPTMIPKNVSINLINNYLIKNNYKVQILSKSKIAIREYWKFKN